MNPVSDAEAEKEIARLMRKINRPTTVVLKVDDSDSLGVIQNDCLSTEDLKQFQSEIINKNDHSSQSCTNENRSQQIVGPNVVLPDNSNEPVVDVKSSIVETKPENQLTFTTREEWNINPKDLSFTDRLGTGTSGRVYKGRYQGKEVAIKILKSRVTDTQVDPRTVREFQHECDIMNKVHSPYVLHFYGSCVEPRVCIVVEYCSRGSLYHVLLDPKHNVSWERVFKWSKEMVTGLAALHSCDPPVYHRDLKSLNLLVDSQWAIKVCDFGLARLGVGNATTLGKMRGTFAYCAPELYFGQIYTKASDVYSLGIILWELVVRCVKGTYDRPYGEYPNLSLGYTIIIKAAKENLRPSFPESVPSQFVDLIKSCWAPEPEKRLNCTEILNILNELENQYQSKYKMEWVHKQNPTKDESADQDEPNNKRTVIPLLGTDSLRTPLKKEDAEDLLGFDNVFLPFDDGKKRKKKWRRKYD
eukprot:TRINITY_DN11080_c0_g1_i1.p1 TRINITY_DN11080_c0_g1~~TRINITY_DN11080_c0_g1_i1.p1  ORF type:complete len:488 (-),score=85.50 TRINITY_DN11080_c0_g1_i1:65-1480(-)